MKAITLLITLYLINYNFSKSYKDKFLRRLILLLI